MEGIDDAQQEDLLEQFGILKVHSHQVQRLPADGKVQGESDRTPNEIWTLQDRVFCTQCSPEWNKNYIKELVINKLLDEGQLDDNRTKTCLELLDEESINLSRHFIMKCMVSFLKTPNRELIEIYQEHAREEAK